MAAASPLQLATLDARRRRHAETEPEHLLAVVLGIDEEAEAIRMRGLDPIELRERTEAALAARPAVGGYRDGAESPPSPALDRALARVRRRAWLPFAKMSLVDSLLLEPAIASLVFGLRRGDDARAMIERARALAVASRHRTFGLDHLVRAALDRPEVIASLERSRGDAAALRSHLDHVLRARPSDGAGVPAVEPPVRRVLYTGSFPEADATPLTTRQLCLGLVRADDCIAFWNAAGVDRNAFVDALLHVTS